MEGSVSCAFMAARLKQIARDQKRIVRGATITVLRDVVGMAEQRFPMAGSMTRNVWGTTSSRGTFRSAYWRGRRYTQKSLGLSSKTKAINRTGATWDKWRKDLKRGSVAAARVSARTGHKAYPLIVRILKTRWVGEVLQTGVRLSGIAANVEQGLPFKPHGKHPGGPVHQHPILARAFTAQQSRLSSNVKAAVDGFLQGAIGG